MTMIIIIIGLLVYRISFLVLHFLLPFFYHSLFASLIVDSIQTYSAFSVVMTTINHIVARSITVLETGTLHMHAYTYTCTSNQLCMNRVKATAPHTHPQTDRHMHASAFNKNGCLTCSRLVRLAANTKEHLIKKNI